MEFLRCPEKDLNELDSKFCEFLNSKVIETERGVVVDLLARLCRLVVDMCNVPLVQPSNDSGSTEELDFNRLFDSSCDGDDATGEATCLSFYLSIHFVFIYSILIYLFTHSSRFFPVFTHFPILILSIPATSTHSGCIHSLVHPFFHLSVHPSSHPLFSHTLLFFEALPEWLTYLVAGGVLSANFDTKAICLHTLLDLVEASTSIYGWPFDTSDCNHHNQQKPLGRSGLLLPVLAPKVLNTLASSLDFFPVTFT